MEEKGCELCIFLNIQGSQISSKKQELAVNIPVTSFLIYPLLPRDLLETSQNGYC